MANKGMKHPAFKANMGKFGKKGAAKKTGAKKPNPFAKKK